MNINKLEWRKNWLGCINELTNLELQKQMWLNQTYRTGPNWNPHWSFIEFMCSYFDDQLWGKKYDYIISQELISKDEYDQIKLWHDALDKYSAPKNNDHDDQAILDDLTWQEIVKIGKESKQNLAYLLTQDEKEYLQV